MKKTDPLIRFYKEYIYKYKVKIIISFVLAIIGGIATAIGPKQLGRVTTAVYNGIVRKVYGTGQIDFKYIYTILITVFCIYFVGTICMSIQGSIVSKTLQKSISKLRNNITKKINKLPIYYFENKNEKKVFSIIDKDVELVTQYFTIIVNELITCITVFIMVICVMFTINLSLAIITTIMIPTLMLMVKMISNKSKIKVRETYNKNDQLNNFCEEIYKRKKLISTLNSNEKIADKFEKLNNKFKKSINKSQFVNMLLEPFTAFIGNLNYLVITFVGAYLAIKGVISIGDIQSFIQYNKLLVKPVYMIGEISNIIFSINEALNRIFEFLDLEEIQEIKDNNLKIKDGNILINNLDFSYDNEIRVLKNINLNIKKGKKVAIVGKTGAGKSTIIKLLMKFYNYNFGGIFIDNNEISKIDVHELRNNIGIVQQDIWLFQGTIKENIMYGNNNATDEEIINAAKLAQVDDFIQTLPDKYETVLDENTSNISLGQKQLICIARMILKNPKIILLDEATNLIDIETEKKLQKAINKITKDKTCIIVAHRLSTIVNADDIIVIDNGKIVEEGSHSKLINQKGLYYEMYNYWL